MKNNKSNIGDVSNLSQQNVDEKNSSKFACIPIGLTQGQFNVNSFNVPEKLKSIQMLSACLFAFCYVYLKDPLQWTSEIINDIVQQGTELVKHNYIDLKDCGIINCIINTQNYKAKIQIQEPTLFDTITARTSIYTSLELFFQTNDYGLFRCSKLCYLIWKSNKIYFIFDGQGRSYSCSLEEEKGFASLICTEMLTDVCKLIKKLSGLTSDDCYSISGIKMKYFRVGLSRCATPAIQFTCRECDVYNVVNPHWAILRGKIHIGSSGFKSTRNRQSMTTNLIALVCNEMQNSNSWNSEFVDQIILLGNKLFRECDNKTLGEITIHQLPRQYSLEDYKCKIDYKPYEHSGKLSNLNDVKNTDLFVKLSEAFERSFKSGYQSSVLIQVNTMVFAVWRNNSSYYLFDAYARNDEGGVSNDKFGRSCVHMHSTLESLCSVLSTNLTTIAENEEFVLHGIDLIFECTCEEQLNHNDLELLTDLMDELCWPEMERFQEIDSSKQTVYNLDDSGDDDIFNGTVDRTEILPRCLSYSSTVSRKTNSSIAVSVISSVKSVKYFTLNSREQSKRNSPTYLSRESSFTGSNKSKSTNGSVASKTTMNSDNAKKSIEARSRNESVTSANSTSMISKKQIDQFNESKTSLNIKQKKSAKFKSQNESLTSMVSNDSINHVKQSRASPEMKRNESAKAKRKRGDDTQDSKKSVAEQGSSEELLTSKKTTIKQEIDDHSMDFMETIEVQQDASNQLNSARFRQSKTSTKHKLENLDEDELHSRLMKLKQETEIKQETEDQAETGELTEFEQSNLMTGESLQSQRSSEKFKINMKERTTDIDGVTIPLTIASTFNIAKHKHDVETKLDNCPENYPAIVKTKSTEANICVIMWELRQEIKKLMQTTEKYDKLRKTLL